ncbi:MAG: trypsin-like peptidase domain-containing protein, partial [Planctomycetota bacterium]
MPEDSVADSSRFQAERIDLPQPISQPTAISITRVGVSGSLIVDPISPAEDEPDSPKEASATPESTRSEVVPQAPKSALKRRPDPIVQSATMLLTMAIMLAAARWAVPGIVEQLRYSWLRGELRAEYETSTAGLKNVSLESLSDAYQMVTASVGPSVVHIDVRRTGMMPRDTDHVGLRDRLVPITDQGSGVIVDTAGYILTNQHVIADGDQITVTLSDGRKTPANIVGSDPLTDLAVLKVDADQLFAITWGDSDRCRVGSPVWAVGSPFGLDRTVTFGIISGKHRIINKRDATKSNYQDFMQSDVAVNPGNSGGPLVDARGTLVGINTAIVGDTYQGVSFSVPSNVARQIYDQIRKDGKVERGWLGVRLVEVPDALHVGNDPRVRGALVLLHTEESPAALAGVREGDLIKEVNNTPIR